jgi:hypothetical protein
VIDDESRVPVRSKTRQPRTEMLCVGLLYLFQRQLQGFFRELRTRIRRQHFRFWHLLFTFPSL